MIRRLVGLWLGLSSLSIVWLAWLGFVWHREQDGYFHE